MISSTSAYLFLKTHNLLLSKGKRCPQHGKPNAECTVVALILLLASSLGARINTCSFSGKPPWYCSNFATY